MHFFHSRRKLCFATAVYNVYLSTKAERCSCSVHCYVSTADNSNLFAAADWRCVILTKCLHQIVSCQVFICGEYAVCIFTRNAHKSWKSGTGTDKDCFKAFFFHQIIHRNCLSNNGIGFNLNAKALYILHFGSYYRRLRKTELRNTIG